MKNSWHNRFDWYSTIDKSTLTEHDEKRPVLKRHGAFVKYFLRSGEFVWKDNISDRRIFPEGSSRDKWIFRRRMCYRKGRSMRQDLCDWFERSRVTVQGSALSPGVFGPRRIHLPSKRRCPKDLYKFACRIPAEVLTTVDAEDSLSHLSTHISDTLSFPETTVLPNFILSIARSRFPSVKFETAQTLAELPFFVDTVSLAH